MCINSLRRSLNVDPLLSVRSFRIPGIPLSLADMTHEKMEHEEMAGGGSRISDGYCEQFGS